MLKVNSRLRGVIEKLEAGEPLTQQAVNDAARLQALDIAIAGEDYVNELCARNDEYTQKFLEL